MTIALLDELLFWMRCRQLRREAREAAERLIEVFESQKKKRKKKKKRRFVQCCIVKFDHNIYCIVLYCI